MTYQDFFKLSDTPFRLTPDVDYFFNSEGHGAALETLLYSIRSGEGFVQITGQPGVGKTMLVRHLLNQLGGEVTTALILHPRLGAEDILKVILEDLGVPSDVIETNTKEGLLRFFRKHLLETGRKGCTKVVIVDEAQEIPEDTLEELRLLSNLETEKKKLLSIILVGQTELEEKLSCRSLRQLHQRITIRYRIDPFSRKETVDYILHRLSIAGATGNVHFSDRVLNTIHRKSAGIPRRINIICERALMAACVEGVRVIKNSHLKSALESYLGTSPLFNKRPYAIGAAAILLVVFVMGGLWWAFSPAYQGSLMADRQAPFSSHQEGGATPGGERIGETNPSPPSSPSQNLLPSDTETDLNDKNPPVDRLPTNWRCLVLDRHRSEGQVWQGNGSSVVPAASFRTQNITLDDGIYLIGRDKDNAPFILSHHDFSPWQRYQGLAEQLWTQYGIDAGLPALPLIIWSGQDNDRPAAHRETAGHIRNMVKGWADAWRALDIDTYIQYYGPTHVNYLSSRQKPNIISREEYYRKKGWLFRKSGYITLQISDPVCMINPADSNTAVAFFSQRYASTHYLDEGVKVLFLRRLTEEKGQAPAWKIDGRFWMPMPEVSEG
jgi:general secretion pathway protein A